jgi:hypothetical protein
MRLHSISPRRAISERSSAARSRCANLKGLGQALNFRRIKITPGETLIIHYSVTGRLEITRQQSGSANPNSLAKPARISSFTGESRPKPAATFVPGVLKTPAHLNRDAGDRVARPRVAAEVAPISDQEFDELAALRKARCWEAPIFQPWHPSYRQVMARLTELEAKERAACG